MEELQVEPICQELCKTKPMRASMTQKFLHKTKCENNLWFLIYLNPEETDLNNSGFHPIYVVAFQCVILLCENDVHSIAVKTSRNYIQAVAEHLQISLKLAEDAAAKL